MIKSQRFQKISLPLYNAYAIAMPNSIHHHPISYETLSLVSLHQPKHIQFCAHYSFKLRPSHSRSLRKAK